MQALCYRYHVPIGETGKMASAIFSADWNHTTAQFNDPNLVVSPINSRKAFTTLIASAHHALLIEAEEMQESSSQLPRPLPGDGLASRLHRNSAYLARRAALASRSDVSGDGSPGRTDKTPVLIQSCRMSTVLSATFLAPIKSAWRV